MRQWRLPQVRRIALWSVATVAFVGLGVLLFAASGFYNVAASRGHFAITRALLEFGMRRSVATRSWGIAVPPLEDPALIRLGAAHYRSGCTFCHGAPGEPRSPIARSMLPQPPDLAATVTNWSPSELFWIVKNGLKYTGMPAWPAQRRGDEVWALVAFLQRLPGMDSAQYRSLAGITSTRQRTDDEPVWAYSSTDALSACLRCHDGRLDGRSNRLIPRLEGQSARYLESALKQYADGSRPSGIMHPVAAALDRASITRLAEYYAGLPAVASSPNEVAPYAVERGRRIAMVGVPESGVPPCLACHSGQNAPTFPRLAGQYAAYIAGQIRLFREGIRSGTTHAAIMAPIARKLTEQEIADVAGYFEQRVSDVSEPTRGNATGVAPESSP